VTLKEKEGRAQGKRRPDNQCVLGLPTSNGRETKKHSGTSGSERGGRGEIKRNRIAV